MTTMVAELYDALLAAGAPDEKARKAAETMAGYEAYEQRFGRIESDIGELKRDIGELKNSVSAIEQRLSGLSSDVSRQSSTLGDVERRLSRLSGELLLLKWMVGFALAFLVAISVKLFLH